MFRRPIMLLLSVAIPAAMLAAAPEDPSPAGGHTPAAGHDRPAADMPGSVPGAGTSHRNHRKTKEFIFLIISYLHISYFLHFCPILPVFCYSVHF